MSVARQHETYVFCCCSSSSLGHVSSCLSEHLLIDKLRSMIQNRTDENPKRASIHARERRKQREKREAVVSKAGCHADQKQQRAGEGRKGRKGWRGRWRGVGIGIYVGALVRSTSITARYRRARQLFSSAPRPGLFALRSINAISTLHPKPLLASPKAGTEHRPQLAPITS